MHQRRFTSILPEKASMSEQQRRWTSAAFFSIIQLHLDD
jgi:hypothetical protein